MAVPTITDIGAATFNASLAQTGNNQQQIGYSAARYLIDTGCAEVAYYHKEGKTPFFPSLSTI
ncbi:hypothetical protein J0B02_02120 [Enterobacteriaceae bacterium YMB-R22]|uniref:hypothetical protein n=1 Tax=Tenebrionicola larvae TaxID=2815733 RepID=UPI0020128B1D|nr:hypothetical protein [Tenebrionicola larvae]MBV4411649.1 hypothetical protein [Tenebrionicola larvae]